MTFDAPLVAAATIMRAGLDPRACSVDDAVHQLQLAHVLLDGGFDGGATLEEALAGGDHGLGTVDRLDGELVVVDGEPWRVDWRGTAELMPLSTRTPFAIVSTLDSPTQIRVQDIDLDQVKIIVEQLVGDPGAIVSVRLEGSFNRVLVRSVKPQMKFAGNTSLSMESSLAFDSRNSSRVPRLPDSTCMDSITCEQPADITTKCTFVMRNLVSEFLVML